MAESCDNMLAANKPSSEIKENGKRDGKETNPVKLETLQAQLSLGTVSPEKQTVLGPSTRTNVERERNREYRLKKNGKQLKIDLQNKTQTANIVSDSTAQKTSNGRGERDDYKQARKKETEKIGKDSAITQKTEPQKCDPVSEYKGPRSGDNREKNIDDRQTRRSGTEKNKNSNKGMKYKLENTESPKFNAAQSSNDEQTRTDDRRTRADNFEKAGEDSGKDLKIKMPFRNETTKHIAEALSDTVKGSRNDDCELFDKQKDNHEKSTNDKRNECTALLKHSNSVCHIESAKYDKPSKMKQGSVHLGRKDRRSVSKENRKFYIERRWNSYTDVRGRNETSRIFKGENVTPTRNKHKDVAFRKEKQNSAEIRNQGNDSRSDSKSLRDSRDLGTRNKYMRKESDVSKQYRCSQNNEIQSSDGFAEEQHNCSCKGTRYSKDAEVVNKDHFSSCINKRRTDENCATSNPANKTEKMKVQAKDKAKKTTLFIYLSEHVNVGDDLIGYITQRMGTSENLTFEINEVNNNYHSSIRSTKAKVTVSFPSTHTASKAMNLLHKSNRGTTKKVFCFYTSQDSREDDKVIEREQKEKADFHKSAQQMVDTAAQALNKHEIKIRSAANRLQEIEQKLSTKRGVSLDVFSTLSQEKQAREDKLTELKSQRNEFKHYLNAMREKLKSLNPPDKSKLTELRRSLGTECHKLEEALPVYARREDILNTVKSSNVSVILGETGSGKSTQLVQYLLQAGFAENGIIACTQPRKIAATSLARHVSGELASKVGQTVGYHVGMRSDKTKDTKILFMTDQVLLNECLKDDTLSKFSFIIIDEAHERSIYTDLLLGMLKKCLVKRSELRIIITSATINPDVFVSYFGGSERCPVLQVSGRTFPVEVIWDEDTYGDPFPEDFERKAVEKAIEVHTTVPATAGDILVFITSPVEAEKSCEKFSAKVTGRNFQCLQLHGKLKPEEQQSVFEPSPKGVRKIVFATNSAETSITIPGVKYVIDTGVVKEMRFDPKKKMNCLSIVPVSQSSSNQRKGRAGRTSPGVCYRLYSQADFQQMEKTGKSEILRVNLGQALLKLLQLNVDPLSFDFVESPDKNTMKDVMATLQQLGAVKKNNLTDVGKWIANLPLEPRLGVLVKNGLELGVPIESLVVATCSSAGGVFFRAGSPEEKKKADLKKIRFCHSGGDLLTVLNVYREWNAVHEKAKGKWCITNCINGKTMKAIRETVKEMLDILKKEMKIDVKYKLCPEETTDVAIQKLVIECMLSNFCFYLGHERAGYITTDLLQHVQIHPGSSLVSMGQQPKWIVYDQILKTSEDYVTNVSPVADECVENYLSEGQIFFNRSYLESRAVSLACKIPVGKYTFWKFVGPMHRGRRELEEMIRSACDDAVVVIEADKQKGEVELYAVSQYRAVATRMLKQILDNIPETLKQEAKEVSLGNDKSGVRAVVGHGGCVVDILMPHEYRSLNIKQKPFSGVSLTEEDIEYTFLSYGPIDQIWRAHGKKQTTFWGRVTFLHGKDAIAAADEINSEKSALIEVFPITMSAHSKTTNELTVRLSWCRRLGKGIAYVYLEYPEDEVPLLMRSPFPVGEKSVEIRHAKRDSNLMISGLSAYVSEDEIKEALAEVLDITLLPNSSRFRVIIPREQASQDARIDLAYRQLDKLLSSVPLNGTYRVNIKEVKEQTARFTAFVCFTDPDDCETVLEECANGSLRVNRVPVEASMDVKTSVVIQKNVFDVVKSDIDRYTQRVHQKSSSTTIKRREIRSGNIVIDINSTSPRKLAKATKSVHDIIDGDCLECEAVPNLHYLFTQNSREVITDIQKCTRTLIVLDQRMFKATIYGSKVPRQTAIQELNLYLNSQSDILELDVGLKRDKNPPGVMKELILQYGTGLQELKDSADLSAIMLNYRLHRVTMKGTSEAIAKGSELIQAVKDKLSLKDKIPESDISDCPICICPVELSQIYRLEYCGHAYCRDCLKDQILNAINDKKFPIECEVEGCGKDIVIRDINIQIKQRAFTSKRLVTAAVDALVAKNGRSYHYCLTPNCEMVYKISSNGELFKCPLCSCRICTTCHVQYHDGMSCAMYNSAGRTDESIKKWLSKNPDNRKICPKCGISIEKLEGCNHVTCTACDAHICWICLEFFAESGQCYGHLRTLHGSYV